MTAVVANPADYATFRILVDEPATSPLLGFDTYAKAFAEMIEHSRAQFAIGIFGTWGSGKTTLMRAIEKELGGRGDIVPVWFNAWRYEREDHLIVPLLDTLRDELERRARSRRSDDTTKRRAKDAAQAMGRAALAISRGLKLRVGIPFAGIGIDADIAAIQNALKDPPPAGPMSFYYGAFAEMESAVRRFGARGERRIVVFIDDLDRCLPASALSVLESMKLFFDFEGFVFVVGLDQDVVQRAIDGKYRLTDERVVVVPGAAHRPGGAGSGLPVADRDIDEDGLFGGMTGSERDVQKLGAEYVKKIFQVPFSLPRISTKDLEPFFGGLLRTSKVPPEQRTDLGAQVRPHLIHLSGGGAVNPREVKRLINAYTLQMKLLSARPALQVNPQAVIAILTMSFRADWRPLYDLLVADPDGFAHTLKSARESGDEVVKLWPADQAMPRDFGEYLDGAGTAILAVDSLEQYVASVEATRSPSRELGPVQSNVVDLGRRLARLAETGAVGPERDEIQKAVHVLQETLTVLPSVPAASRIQRGSNTLSAELQTAPWERDIAQVKEWARRNETLVRGMYENLRQLRNLTDVGGHA